jgi:hypothetical protein
MAVDQPDTRELAREPISPELVLVSPELAEYARAQLPDRAPSIFGERNGADAPMTATAPLKVVPARTPAAVPHPVTASPAPRRGRVRPKAVLLAVFLSGLLVAGVLVGLRVGRSPERESGAEPLAPSRAALLAVTPGSTTRGGTAAPAQGTPRARRRPAAGAHRAGAARAPAKTTAKTERTRTRKAKAKPATTPSARTRTARKVKTHAPAPAATPKTAPPPSEPELTWNAVAGANYYDVQLFRENVRILDLWPSTPHVTVPAAWVYGGVHYRLEPGRYRWYVYPGTGEISQLVLGKLHKVGVLVVPRGR